MADSQFPHLPQTPGLPMRRQFTELHPKDQTIKLNRKARIESNWGINVQDCLPLHIRPRMELKKGAKARVGDVGVAEEIWWNWSVELLRSLEELSTMTATKLSFAQELLHLEVSQRQQNPKHPQRKIVELLLGDVQRVIDGMRRNQQAINLSSMETEVDEDNMEYEEEEEHRDDEFPDEEDNEAGDEGEATEHNNGMDTGRVPIRGNGGNNAHGSPGLQRHTATPARLNNTNMYSSPPPALGRFGGDQRQLSIIEVKASEMRARAVRLRAQSTKLEAEAIELEADAAELRAHFEEQS